MSSVTKKGSVSKVETKKLNLEKKEGAAKEIDDLFGNINKKRKQEDEDEDQNNKSANKTKTVKKVKNNKIDENGEELESDSDDDGGFEYLSDDEDQNLQDPTDDVNYGLIKSKYAQSKVLNPEAPLERIDRESGLPVYKAHLLKVGQGGGTPLCPFDCNCCF